MSLLRPAGSAGNWHEVPPAPNSGCYSIAAQGKLHRVGQPWHDTEAEAADAAWQLLAQLRGQDPAPPAPPLVPIRQKPTKPAADAENAVRAAPQSAGCASSSLVLCECREAL